MMARVISPWLGPQQSWETISFPTGWARTLPFVVQSIEQYRNYRAVNFDVEDYAPSMIGKSTKYVDYLNGDDGNDGSALTPYKSIKKAVGIVNVGLIYVRSGVYPFDAVNGGGWDGYATAQSFTIRPWDYSEGKIILSTHENLAWAIDPANPNTYKASIITTVYDVRDASNIDKNYDYVKLIERANAGEVNDNSNSWYSDGVSIWIRLFDNRVPDNNVRPYVNNYNGRITHGCIVLAINIEFHGGNYGFYATTGAGFDRTISYFKRCKFKYSRYSGFRTIGTDSYLQECEASANGDDGFSYAKGACLAGTCEPRSVEINCASHDNGMVGDNDNASTCHDTGSIIRLMGLYERCFGPIIHDVGLSESWNLGCIVGRSRGIVNDINFEIGSGGTGGTMWLDGIKSRFSLIDLYIDINSTMRIKNIKSQGNNTINGTLEDY